MTADHAPLPGEPTAGRHRPGRLSCGVEVHRAIARSGYRFGDAHTSHSLEQS